MDQFTEPFIEPTPLQICEQCEEDAAKFICQQCDSIFCEKCFEVLHRSEKKKKHEKKEIKKDFIPQKCSKHENKKLNFFCLDENVKCCSLCLLYEHKNHDVVPISEATKNFKTRISEIDFMTINSNLEKEMKEIDKEITSKQKELLEYQAKIKNEILNLTQKKQQKVELLESIQKISDSIKREEDIDRIIEWNIYLKEQFEFKEYRIYASGSNTLGEIGLGKDVKIVDRFTKINRMVEWISCGAEHNFAYYGGKLYGCGSNDCGQLGIENVDNLFEFTELKFFSQFEISNVWCGSFQTFVQCKNRKLFCFGSNEYGELGIGEDSKLYNFPQELKFFENLKLKEIICGFGFSFAICENDIFSWGKNSFGQLGQGDTKNRSIPTKIDFFNGKKILQIACGDDHCLALGDNGNVYSWGDNQYGQLGITSSNFSFRETKPKLMLKKLQGVQMIFCGDNHSVILQNGILTSFGNNKFGQLALGDNDDRNTFSQVNMNLKVIKYETSGSHSIMMLENGDVYTCGRNDCGQLGIGNKINCNKPTKVEIKGKIIDFKCLFRNICVIVE